MHDTTLSPPGEYRPTGQGEPVGDVTPGLQAEPGAATHGPEHPGDTSPVALPKVRAGHAVQEVAPSVVGAYRPMGQAKHADRPSPGEYVPVGHGEQDPAFAVDEKRPAGQGAPAPVVMPMPQ